MSRRAPLTASSLLLLSSLAVAGPAGTPEAPAPRHETGTAEPLRAGASVVALAEPAPAPTAEASTAAEVPASYRGYVAAGVGAGFLKNEGHAAFSLEAGTQIGHGPLWIHGAFGLGAGEQPIQRLTFFERAEQGSYQSARVGAELRWGGDIRLVGGVDVGVERVSYHLVSDFLRHTDEAVKVVDAVLVPRVAVELGGGPVVVRPQLEGAVSAHGRVGAGASIVAMLRF